MDPPANEAIATQEGRVPGRRMCPRFPLCPGNPSGTTAGGVSHTPELCAPGHHEARGEQEGVAGYRVGPGAQLPSDSAALLRVSHVGGKRTGSPKVHPQREPPRPSGCFWGRAKSRGGNSTTEVLEQVTRVSMPVCCHLWSCTSRALSLRPCSLLANAVQLGPPTAALRPCHPTVTWASARQCPSSGTHHGQRKRERREDTLNH